MPPFDVLNLMVTLETAFQSFGPPVFGSVPQSTMGSGGAAWKAAMASRWIVLVGDHRPKILLIVIGKKEPYVSLMEFIFLKYGMMKIQKSLFLRRYINLKSVLIENTLILINLYVAYTTT